MSARSGGSAVAARLREGGPVAARLRCPVRLGPAVGVCGRAGRGADIHVCRVDGTIGALVGTCFPFSLSRRAALAGRRGISQTWCSSGITQRSLKNSLRIGNGGLKGRLVERSSTGGANSARHDKLKRDLQYYPTCAESGPKAAKHADSIFASRTKCGDQISAGFGICAIRLFLQVPLQLVLASIARPSRRHFLRLRIPRI